MHDWVYGYCKKCDEPLNPVYFTDEETEVVNGSLI